MLAERGGKRDKAWEEARHRESGSGLLEYTNSEEAQEIASRIISGAPPKQWRRITAKNFPKLKLVTSIRHLGWQRRRGRIFQTAASFDQIYNQKVSKISVAAIATSLPGLA